MSKKEKIVKETKCYADECDKIGEIAISYGFSVIVPPNISSEDISKAKIFKDFDFYNDCEEKISLTRWFEEKNCISEPPPIMIHYKKPLHGSSHKKKPNEDIYGFEIMGSTRSTSEALLIKTALSVLSDLGYDDLYIDINSIGDKESMTKFERELGSYYRKHSHELPAKIRQELKKNPYSIIANASPEVQNFSNCAPQTISTLSDISRTHFKEVLEYIEAFDCLYKICPSLISNKMYASNTIFEIRQVTNKKEEEPILAYGYRYNYLAKKIGGKRDIPTMGMTIIVKKNLLLSKKVIIKNIKKPRFYLIQLGNTAKLKALNVVETLRKQKISVYHSLTKDKIGGQLSGADYMKATHLLIIGQKEALENTVVVRNINNREQETIKVSELGDFLKALVSQNLKTI